MRNWPEAGLFNPSSYAIGLTQQFSDEDRATLRAANISTSSIMVDGRVWISRAIGQMADGGSMIAAWEAMKLKRQLNLLRWHLAERMAQIAADGERAALRHLPGEWGPPDPRRVRVLPGRRVRQGREAALTAGARLEQTRWPGITDAAAGGWTTDWTDASGKRRRGTADSRRRHEDRGELWRHLPRSSLLLTTLGWHPGRFRSAARVVFQMSTRCQRTQPDRAARAI